MRIELRNPLNGSDRHLIGNDFASLSKALRQLMNAQMGELPRNALGRTASHLINKADHQRAKGILIVF
jgi:hypothetical protein